MTVGGRTPIKTDVRIIAATNKDLRTLIQQGLFREDLFYRLNVVPVRLPPLRDRMEDIPDLVRHFMTQQANEGLPEKSFETAALDRLKQHTWPGNVRELENLTRRLLALVPHDTITEDAVSRELEAEKQTLGTPPTSETMDPSSWQSLFSTYLDHVFQEAAPNDPKPGLYYRLLRNFEGPLVAATLMATRGNQVKAADILGLNRNTLRKKIRDLDMNEWRDGRIGRRL
jgi:two-component system nitrogen regulation response regulator GlnG